MLERIVINPEVMVEKRVIKGIRNCILNISIKRYPYHFGLLSLIISLNSFSSTGIEGQLSGWGIVVDNSQTNSSSVGLRYIPGIFWGIMVNNESTLDLEFSGNIFTSFSLNHFDQFAENAKLKPYRWWIRYATPHTESRLGLQKINFGPALILRSLRWFDRLDLRDPLQMTDGVYALRFKYDFLNNTNIWVWGLYGNEKTKGYETLPTTPKKPEFGGRFQLPVPYGEFATTFHTRNVDSVYFKYDESRIAFDGRWDVVLGFWFESVLQHNKSDFLPFEWNKMITLGSDYTIGIGNGLHILVEHMSTVASKKIFRKGENIQVSAFYMSYPIGFFDNVMAIGYYSWKDRKYYQYFGWQRTYDNLIFNVSLFHYPQSGENSVSNDKNSLGSGYGTQIMFIFNH